MDNSFCPECDTYLRPVEIADEKDQLELFMRCINCNFSRKENKYTSTHFAKHSAKKNTLDISPNRVRDLVNDKTYPVTKQLECANRNCPSKKDNKNPEIVLLTSNDYPELGYICKVCYHVWGKI